MRVRYPRISDAVDQVLREVDAEDRIKTAEQQLLRESISPRSRTKVASDLKKLAASCRTLDENNPEVSYQDLHNFMAQVNAK